MSIFTPGGQSYTEPHETVEARGSARNRPITVQTSPPIKVVSLFSGCGGMDLGFVGGFSLLGKRYAKNPFDILWANDFNEAACRTYARNVGKHVHHGDIWKLIDQVPNEADVVIGGFPCQDISVNGKGLGVDGKRSGLYRAMVEVVSRIRPKVFVAENVKGLLMKHNAKSLERVLTDFKALGYDVSFQLYNAADYGVPQSRERVIIVGTRPDVPKFQAPKPTHNSQAHVTVKQAIGDLVTAPENEEFNHIWSRASKSAEQGSRRMVADRPGYTIRAECHGNIQFHYELPRRISMREAARLQSFPDKFIFDSKLRETERQVGNAVPPVLAWHIARAVAHCLK
jgi:DNA (cytosine-5)-methyltransferase 1